MSNLTKIGPRIDAEVLGFAGFSQIAPDSIPANIRAHTWDDPRDEMDPEAMEAWVDVALKRVRRDRGVIA